MKFYFTDSPDIINPTYDFRRDENSPLRVRQRDDLYAREALDEPPYQGLLVSKSIIDDSINGAGKYTEAQRNWLYRLGVRRYFRLPESIETMRDNSTFNTSAENPRPAWIVNGQQRSLALARTKKTRLPVPVAGFVAASLETQREGFPRVNTVQPLPSNLVTELLPEIARVPSARMSTRNLPSPLVDMLNQDAESPFVRLIRRVSSIVDDKRNAVVTDTGLVGAQKESLESPSGVLFPYRNIAAGTTDTSGIQSILITCWAAVRNTFPEAWAEPATRSRLLEGVSIRAMGRLMERVMAHVDVAEPANVEQAEAELGLVADVCCWTSDVWTELGLRWDELQDTPRHLSALSNFLARTYVTRRAAKR